MNETTMQRVEKNRVVSVTYEIWDQQGNLFEKSDLPISYVQGSEYGLYLKVEQALNGKCVGDEITVQLSPDEGFGHHDARLTFTDDVDNVPPQFRQVGTEVEFQNDKGETKTFIVTRIEHGKLTVDGNHAMAGQTVTFKVKVVGVRAASQHELQTGQAEIGMAPPALLQ